MAHGSDTRRILENCRVALTGRFASLTQEEFRAVVVDMGGRVDGSPLRSTTYLVVGDAQLPLDEQARPPRALEKARRLQVLGYPIEILSEHDFLGRYGLPGSAEPGTRLYTIGQLAQILGIKRDLIRNWLRAGLISPLEIVHRLSFFDFAQVQSAKTLCDLAKCGVSTGRIRASLEQLRKLLPNLGTSLSQLALLEDSGRLLVRDSRCGLMESTGQLQLEFGSDGEADFLPWSRHITPDEAFDEALKHHDNARYAEAATLYRKAIDLDPNDPVLYFNLATVQYEQGQLEDSCASYLKATQLDFRYVEAWNALGCVLSQMRRSKESVVALRRAVELVPEYGDAHFNLASELEQLGELAPANKHWRRYLELDNSGPWADTARAHLEASETERVAT